MRIVVPIAVGLLTGCAGSGLRVAPTDDTGRSPPNTDDTDPETDTETDTYTDTDPDDGPWRHTIAVDGDPGDFLAAERFATSGGTVGLTWDDTHLYVLVEHPDVATGGPEHWVLVYLGDGSTGTTTGVQFNTQQPELPTPFSHLIRWKADDSWHAWTTWDGAAWNDAPLWLGTSGSAYAEHEGNETLEIAVPLAAFGATDTAVVHVAWLFEGAGFESSYAPAPAGSFVDGYDPDYGAWYAFDLLAPTSPASTAPSP